MNMSDNDVYMLDCVYSNDVIDTPDNYTGVNTIEWLEETLHYMDPVDVFNIINDSKDRGYNIDTTNQYYRFYGDINSHCPDYLKTSDNAIDLIDIDTIARHIIDNGDCLENETIKAFLFPENVKRDNFVMDRFMKVV